MLVLKVRTVARATGANKTSTALAKHTGGNLFTSFPLAVCMWWLGRSGASPRTPECDPGIRARLLEARGIVHPGYRRPLGLHAWDHNLLGSLESGGYAL